MDYALLIDKYLSDKQALRSEDDSLNIELFISGDASGWRFANIPAPSLAELEALSSDVQAQLEKEAKNKESIQFLADTDYKVLKYRDQMDMGHPTDLSIEQFQVLLAQRQAARDAIK